VRSLPAFLALMFAASTPASPSTPAIGSAPAMVLPFIHDDYPRALAQARARKLPLFIESWAPW
jgi:hypothetical protein